MNLSSVRAVGSASGSGQGSGIDGLGWVGGVVVVVPALRLAMSFTIGLLVVNVVVIMLMN